VLEPAGKRNTVLTVKDMSPRSEDAKRSFKQMLRLQMFQFQHIPTIWQKWGWFIIGFTMVYLIIQQP
jgi:hypothetical protein